MSMIVCARTKPSDANVATWTVLWGLWNIPRELGRFWPSSTPGVFVFESLLLPQTCRYSTQPGGGKPATSSRWLLRSGCHSGELTANDSSCAEREPTVAVVPLTRKPDDTMTQPHTEKEECEETPPADMPRRLCADRLCTKTSRTQSQHNQTRTQRSPQTSTQSTFAPRCKRHNKTRKYELDLTRSPIRQVLGLAHQQMPTLRRGCLLRKRL